MELPQGFKVQGECIIYKLQKSLYCLCQALRQWISKFTFAMLQLGFSQSKSDYSLFTKGKDQSIVALLVYVDDIIIARSSSIAIANVKQQLQTHFKLKDLGILHYFLGLEIACSKAGIFLSQRKYTLPLLKDTIFLGCKPAELLIDYNIKLNSIDSDPLPDSSQYRRLVV